MPPDNFRAPKADDTAGSRVNKKMVLLPLVCGALGLVAISVLNGTLGSALHLAESSDLPAGTMFPTIEMSSDEPAGLGSRDAQIMLEHAAQAMHDMPTSEAASR